MFYAKEKMMKNRISFVSLAVPVLALAMLCGCKDKSANNQQPTATSPSVAQGDAPTVKEEKVAGLSCKPIVKEKKEKGLDVKMEIDFPTDGNPILVNAIREYISESLGVEYAGDGLSMQGSYDGDLADGEKMTDYYFNLKVKELKGNGDVVGEGSERPDLESQTKISKGFESDKVVTFDYHSYEYMGGAHGGAASDGTTFRKTDGRRLGWDLFVSGSGMQEVIKNGLMEYFQVKTEEELTECLSLDNTVFFPLPQTPPLFQKDGILFIYQQYEIAAYAAGQPSFILPYDKAKKMMNNTGKQLVP